VDVTKFKLRRRKQGGLPQIHRRSKSGRELPEKNYPIGLSRLKNRVGGKRPEIPHGGVNPSTQKTRTNNKKKHAVGEVGGKIKRCIILHDVTHGRRPKGENMQGNTCNCTPGERVEVVGLFPPSWVIKHPVKGFQQKPCSS